MSVEGVQSLPNIKKKIRSLWTPSISVAFKKLYKSSLLPTVPTVNLFIYLSFGGLKFKNVLKKTENSKIFLF